MVGGQEDMIEDTALTMVRQREAATSAAATAATAAVSAATAPDDQRAVA
jgi:hypothetical protein